MDANSAPLQKTAFDPSIGIRRLESRSLETQDLGASPRWDELLALLREQLRRDFAQAGEGIERLLTEAEGSLSRLLGDAPAALDADSCSVEIQELEALFAQLEEVVYALGLGLHAQEVRP